MAGVALDDSDGRDNDILEQEASQALNRATLVKKCRDRETIITASGNKHPNVKRVVGLARS